MKQKLLLCAAAILAAASSAYAQTKKNPLPGDPPTGSLQCKQVVYVVNAACPSGVSKVTGGCTVTGVPGKAQRTKACA
jgi:hypothetical protein